MEQVEVCNSWEEFDDNNKLLEQQLEKLKLQKGCQKSLQGTKSDIEVKPAEDSPVPKMRILKRNVPAANTEQPIQNGTEIASTNGSINNDDVVIQDDNFRTQYNPPEPRISILTRPKKNGSSPREPTTANNSGNTNASQTKTKNQPIKTLEQREQEYAEARKRIFGDEPPENDSEESSET